MIIGNQKPIRIIGYAESTMTQEFFSQIKQTHDVEVMHPNDFTSQAHKDMFQYIVSVSWDPVERQQIINFVDHQDLDLVTVIHDTCYLGQDPPAQIGAGSFVFPFCSLALGSKLGRHSILGYYSMIGHYSQLGDNCILRPGSMVNGKSTVGDRCVLNTRSTVTAGATLTNDVTLMAFCSVTKDITSAGNYAGSPARKI